MSEVYLKEDLWGSFKLDSSKKELDLEDIKKYIHDEELYIDQESWKRFKLLYSKDNITDVISEAIVKGLIKLPLKKITLEDAIDAQKRLMQCQTSIKFGKIFSRYESDLDDYYFDESSAYNDASNYFHQESRYKAASSGFVSPSEIWGRKSSAKSAASALFSLKFDEVSPNSLNRCIALRHYIASQFKPSIAKAIYDYFKAENVVDPCSGWGDRLSGFYASETTKSYFGVDPNTRLIDGYNRQIEEYNKLVNKEAKIVCDGAESEDVVFPRCDLVFTSPPYFCKEKYSDDEKQSYLMYSEIDDWLNKFLFVLLEKSYNALDKDGHLVLNISNVYVKSKIYDICTPMIKYAEELGFTHTGTWGIKMSKRVNSESYKDGIFCEPVYIFKKN